MNLPETSHRKAIRLQVIIHSQMLVLKTIRVKRKKLLVFSLKQESLFHLKFCGTLKCTIENKLTGLRII